MAVSKESKQKKQDTRVDFTPMVDMMMLLITFFMLCTSLAKPGTMQLTMPSNDQNMNDDDKSKTKASRTMTIILAGDNKIFHIDGMPKYDDPTCLKETTYGKDGIRKAMRDFVDESDGVRPIAELVKAKLELDIEKRNNPEMEDSVYKNRLAEIKKGNLKGGKKVKMTVIIKATDDATYENVVAALDEMTINCIGTYVIDKITEDDEALLELKGVKIKKQSEV